MTIFWSVAYPSKPPNVMIGVKQAKYKNAIAGMHWKFKASLKSLKYHGSLRLRSPIKPPQSLPVLWRPGSFPCPPICGFFIIKTKA